MEINYAGMLPADFKESSRVWIYQSDREFTGQEYSGIKSSLNSFAAGWQTHGEPVTSFTGIFFNHFIIIIADETHASVSGCSTDSSVRFIKQMEKSYKLDFFDRSNLAFIVDDGIEIIPLGKFSEMVHSNIIKTDTLYFNNTIVDLASFKRNWIIPVKKSWLAERFALTNTP